MTPKGWESRKLIDIFEFKNGVNADKEQYGSGTKFINVSEIFKNISIYEKDIPASVNIVESKVELYLVKKGDILFNRTSETFDEIGLTAVYLDSARVVFGGFVIRARPTTDELSFEFCKYAFSSSKIRKEIIRRGQGAIRANIGQGDLGAVPIVLPPKNEQEKIAKILSTWDDAIEKLKKLIKAKKLRKKGLMQQLLTGKKRFNGFNGKWEELELGELGEFHKGKGLAKKDLSDSGLSCIRYAELYTKHNCYIKRFYSFISQEIALTSKRLIKGDIIFAGSGEKLEDIGKCAAFIDDIEAYVGGDTVVMSPNIKRVESLFLGFYLNSQCLRRQIYKLGQGHTVVHLYSKDIKKLKVKIPCLDEQKQISFLLVRADKELEMYQNKVKDLGKQKKGLMQQLLTGKKRVVLDE